MGLQRKGHYQEAVDRYTKAVTINTTYDQAYFHMAESYFSMGRFDECAQYCDLALTNKTANYADEIYLLKGRALHAAGNYKAATDMFMESLSLNPDNYATYYALANSQYKLDEPDNAENALSMALSLQSTHAESHLLLAQIMEEKGERLKSALALTNFLLLEPKGPRAEKAFADLQTILNADLEKVDSKTPVIRLTADTRLDDLKSAELVASLLHGNAKLDESVGGFVGEAQTLFAMLGALQKNKSDFWWNFYVNFYTDLNDNNLVETLCYYVSQSAGEESLAWLSLHHTQVEQLFDWVNGYSRKF